MISGFFKKAFYGTPDTDGQLHVTGCRIKGVAGPNCNGVTNLAGEASRDFKTC